MTFATDGARRSLGALLIAIPLLAGCAHLPAATTPPGAQVPPSAAAVDSGPSPDANAVLATIPEPLAQGQKVAPATPAPGESPARAPIPAAGGVAAAGGGVAAGAATGAHDTASVPGAVDTAVIVPADTVRADVPVPAPTQPLKPAPTIAAGALIATQAPPPPPAPEKPAPPDTCYRIQVGAPDNKEEAEKVRKAAVSQLLVPFVIQHEKSRYKIRTQDCFDVAGAESMRKRAQLAGFPQAFRIRVRP